MVMLLFSEEYEVLPYARTCTVDVGCLTGIYSTRLCNPVGGRLNEKVKVGMLFRSQEG